MKDLENLQRDLINAMGTRPPKGKGKGRHDNRGGEKKRWMFKGCWECGLEGHSRKDCKKWRAILDSKGLPPAGHKGAKDHGFFWLARCTQLAVQLRSKCSCRH